jgi:hypothetical protein
VSFQPVRQRRREIQPLKNPCKPELVSHFLAGARERQMTTSCHAQADRHDAGVLRCHPCGLFWEITDRNPPPCPFDEERRDPSPMSVLARTRDCGKTVFTG